MRGHKDGKKKLTASTPFEGTVIVADDIVQVHLGLDLLAVHVGQSGTEDMTILNADVTGALVERHVGGRSAEVL